MDNLDTSRFQVKDLFLDGQGDLEGRFLDGNVLTREGPVENGHRTSQHTLDWLVCAALGIAGPLDSNWVEASDISPDDWWFHPTHTVRLNPSVLTEEVARQVLTEVFNHVIALKFTVNQDIKVHFFLPFDPFIGSGFHKGIVFCFCDFATAEG